MGLPACFHLADEVFPRVRAEAARRLVAAGMSQKQAADALRVSQAMVSKYVTGRQAESDAVVLRLAEDLHRRLTNPPQASSESWCAVLGPLADDTGRDALDDVLAAEIMLRKNVPARLLPQVGLNLARARVDARAAEDVLAYPGRLVEVAGSLVPPAPPQWGGSNHLAGLLLHLRGRDPAVHALANVRGGRDVAQAAQRRGLRPARLAPGSDVEAAFRQAADAGKTPPRLLLDEGRVGFEPCLYVAGRDAREVATTILQLHDALVNP